ncbi:leucine-rich repeat-containing protein 52 [Oxyura jamaicensis]|uniref:leucine-rich repeat-containing protein 52 n=1 Tax=Oxyura jamaicensis TaxID=8884 RepID=UPI0015A6ED43|nr:leucine-rich repeat-containing protein 52 [Oxyura jamaicensis]
MPPAAADWPARSPAANGRPPGGAAGGAEGPGGREREAAAGGGSEGGSEGEAPPAGGQRPREVRGGSEGARRGRWLERHRRAEVKTRRELSFQPGVVPRSQLQEFPAAIPLDTRQLILAANNVSYLPAVELSFLADLVYLDCQKNLLGDDLDFTFIGVAKLVYLDLSFNNLTQVTFGTFSQLLSLVVLKISDNPNLVAIEKDAFANNTWLRHLDVSRTGLTFLDTSTVRDLPNLRFLGLSDNPWHCNCSFLDFITWMTDSNVYFPDADNITCYTPEAFRALKLPAAEVQLHFSCLTHLHKQDYIFLCFIGFCIFFAGTVAAWLAGVCAVIYQVHASKGEEDEEEEEDAIT